MAQTPPTWAFDPDKIPAALKALPRWAPWRAVWNEKRQKFDKLPFAATSRPFGISTAHPERWYSFEQALAAYEADPGRFAGVGYCITTPHGVVGVDLDRCIEGNQIKPWAQAVVDKLHGYTELSPSGEGLRILVAGEVPADWTNHEVGIEVYGGNTARFLTVTGQRLRACTTLDLAPPEPEALAELTTTYARERTSATVISLAMPDVLPEALLPDLASLNLPAKVLAFLNQGEAQGDRSRALFAAAVALYNAGLGDDEVFGVLANSTHALEVALDHRRQDHDRALTYLWVEHCCKGKAKSSPVATLADFENLVPSAPVAEASPADDFEVIDGPPAPAPAPAHKAPRFEVVPVDQFASAAPPRWVVKGVLPEAELVVLFGESGSGKSFVALDMAAAIAQGLAWRGRRTKPGRQVYIAAEGARGFRNRVNAYARHHGIDLAELNLGVIQAAPNLMLRDDALDVSRAILAGGPVSVVWIDTFAQTMPGANENAGEDVGKALAHCKGIHRATGAVVVLIHHAGKDSSKGARGWSGLRAAADAELEVVRAPTGRMLRTTKQKDGGDSEAWGFDLEVVPIGVDEDGEVVTSCVVVESAVPVAEASRAGRPVKAGGYTQRCLEVLSVFAEAQTAGIEFDSVVAEVVARTPEGDDAAGTNRRRQASKALRRLLADASSGFGLDEEGCVCVL